MIFADTTEHLEPCVVAMKRQLALVPPSRCADRCFLSRARGPARALSACVPYVSCFVWPFAPCMGWSFLYDALFAGTQATQAQYANPRRVIAHTGRSRGDELES